MDGPRSHIFPWELCYAGMGTCWSTLRHPFSFSPFILLNSSLPFFRLFFFSLYAWRFHDNPPNLIALVPPPPQTHQRTPLFPFPDCDKFSFPRFPLASFLSLRTRGFVCSFFFWVRHVQQFPRQNAQVLDSLTDFFPNWPPLVFFVLPPPPSSISLQILEGLVDIPPQFAAFAFFSSPLVFEFFFPFLSLALEATCSRGPTSLLSMPRALVFGGVNPFGGPGPFALFFAPFFSTSTKFPFCQTVTVQPILPILDTVNSRPLRPFSVS